ncbi:DUF1850 domain-containing protein [Haloferacaceae archaeon DSL9]
MSSRRLLLVGVVFLLVGSAALVASAAEPQQTLIVETTDGEERLAVPVEDGDTFTIEYTHSVEKTPVIEEYTIRDGKINHTRLVFSSYGAGLPSNADVERTEDGAFTYEPNVVSAEFYVMPGSRVAGHVLVVDGKTYDLHDRSDGETVRIYVSERTTVIDSYLGTYTWVHTTTGAGPTVLPAVGRPP